MSDDQEHSEPPKLNVPNRKKVVRRQTKKLPKIKLSDSAASGSGGKQIPRVAAAGEPKSDTSRIELPADEELTLAPDEMETLAKGAEVVGDGTKNQTMRISLEQEVVDDTTEISPKDTSDLTAEIDLEDDSAKTDTGKMGIPGEVKSNTSKIDLTEAFEVKPPEAVGQEADPDDEIFKSTTMPMEPLDGITEPKEPVEDPAKNTTMAMSPLDEEPSAPEPEAPEGIQDAPAPDEKEFFKSSTVPMTPLDEVDDDFDESEELTLMPADSLQEAAKSTTMPMEPLDDIEDAPTMPAASGGGDEDIFKSTTLPMDSEEIKEAAAGAAAAVPRKKTMKISRKNLQKPGETPETAETQVPGVPNRPRTIKLKRPDEQQLKTVKLQKQSADGEKKSTSRIELPDELQEGPATEMPGRKKTIKLKRAPAGGASETPSTAKTIQVNRPNRPASVAAPSADIDEGGELDLSGGLDLQPVSSEPNLLWSILALFGIAVSGAATWFLYQAYSLAGGY